MSKACVFVLSGLGLAGGPAASAQRSPHLSSSFLEHLTEGLPLIAVNPGRLGGTAPSPCLIREDRCLPGPAGLEGLTGVKIPRHLPPGCVCGPSFLFLTTF